MAQDGLEWAHAPGEHEPNFIMPRHGVVREDNWEECAAQGFQWLRNFDGQRTNLADLGWTPTGLGETWKKRGYTGDAWDKAAGRPLRHKPGIGLYLGPAAEEPTETPHSTDDPATS